MIHAPDQTTRSLVGDHFRTHHPVVRNSSCVLPIVLLFSFALEFLCDSWLEGLRPKRQSRTWCAAAAPPHIWRRMRRWVAPYSAMGMCGVRRRARVARLPRLTCVHLARHIERAPSAARPQQLYGSGHATPSRHSTALRQGRFGTSRLIFATGIACHVANGAGRCKCPSRTCGGGRVPFAKRHTVAAVVLRLERARRGATRTPGRDTAFGRADGCQCKARA